MNIILGRTVVSALNPPNEGTVQDGKHEWFIGRNSQGKIVLRAKGQCHLDFVNGMYMSEFLEWINQQTNNKPSLPCEDDTKD